MIDPGGARHEVSLVRVVLRRIRFFINLAFLATLFFKLFFLHFSFAIFIPGNLPWGEETEEVGFFCPVLPEV